MQIHPGSFRNHNRRLFEEFGRDKGADIPTRTDYVSALKPLLDRYGNERALSIILFTLDESSYARELAPLAGHYPCLKLGPAWWFHDSPEGMRRFRSGNHRDCRVLQHRRLQRRHPRIPLDPRASRRRAAHRLRLPRPASRGTSDRGLGSGGARCGPTSTSSSRPTACEAFRKNRESLSSGVGRYAYDRDNQDVGIVHFGIGAFHRAHQAWYTDLAMDAGESNWAICGVSLRSSTVADQLVPQDGLYTLTQRSAAGASTRLIGAAAEVLFAPQQRQQVISRIASANCHIVSCTVTEKGTPERDRVISIGRSAASIRCSPKDWLCGCGAEWLA